MAHRTERYDRHDDTWMNYWFDHIPEIQTIVFDIDENGYFEDLTFYYVGSNEPHAVTSLVKGSRLRMALEGLLEQA